MATCTKATTTIFVAILTSLSTLSACGEQAPDNTGAMRAAADVQARADPG
jgi:hypothetical protein